MGVSGAEGTGTVGTGTAGDHDSEVAGLEMLTRALVGITLQSLEVLGGEVSLPQFRLLLAASTLGRVPSSRLAEGARVPAASGTPLAPRLPGPHPAPCRYSDTSGTSTPARADGKVAKGGREAGSSG